MPIEDLFKAMDMFKQGAQEYQQTQAVNDARTQLGALQQQQLQEGASEKSMQDYRVRTAAVGQDLALRLTAANASPLGISAATSGLVPSASETEQNRANMALEQARMTSTAPGSPAGLEKTRAETAFLTHKMMMDAMLGKNQQKDMNEAQKTFEKRPDVAPLLKNSGILDEAINQLQTTKGADGSAIFANLARIGLVKNANGGRPSQQEFQAVEDSPAFYDKVRKSVGLATTGTYPENKTQFYIDALTRNKQNNIKSLSNAIDSHSEGSAALNPKLDASVVKTGLRAKYSNILGDENKNTADVSAALDWLASDEGAAANPATIKAVRDQIKKLRGQ